MRILADHSRGMVNLLADGVVPSNEDRGYVLRRVMRRAIQQGGAIGLEAPYLGRFAETAIDMLGALVPQLEAERDTIMGWVAAEEESFGRTLHRGSELLRRVVSDAKAGGATEVDAEEAFRLHDTYGFPFEVTQELLAEEGLGGLRGRIRRAHGPAARASAAKRRAARMATVDARARRSSRGAPRRPNSSGSSA